MSAKCRQRERMDIKGIIRNVIPMGAAKSDEAKAKSKTDADNDREGNGQEGSGGEHQRRKLTPEELKDAVKYLEDLPGIKDHNLTVKLESSNDVIIVYVQDRDGRIVRRIPESELSLLTSNREKKSGHLLNRAL